MGAEKLSECNARRRRELARSPLRGLDRLGQGREVVCPVVAASIDEERRGSRDTTFVRSRDVLGDPRRVRTAAQRVLEPLCVQTQLLRIAKEGAEAEVVLMVEQQVV